MKSCYAIPRGKRGEHKTNYMNYQDVIKAIKNKDFKPIYFLCGDETYFIDQIVEVLEEHVVEPAMRDFNLTEMYGRDTDISTVLNSAGRYPMMAERQLVIIKEAQFLNGLTDLTGYVKNPVPSTVLVFVYKNKKLDGRTKFAQALKKSDGLYYEAKKLYDNQLPGWIKSYVKSIGMKIGDKEAFMLGEYLGTDLSKVVNELDKLKLNLEKGAAITADDIEKHVGLSKDYNVFELQEALVKRDVAKVFRIVRYFGDNIKDHNLVMIVAVLASYFSKLYVLRAGGVSSPRDATKVIGNYPPFIVQKYLSAARSYKPRQLMTILESLHLYDIQSKGVGVKSVSQYDLMRQMASDILSVTKPDYDAVYMDVM